MSDVSKWLGLDKDPTLEKDINLVGNAVLSGIEAASPIAKGLITTLEAVGSKPITTPVAISTVGTVVAVLDPPAISTLEASLNAGLLLLGLSQTQINALDTFIAGQLSQAGITVPSAT